MAARPPGPGSIRGPSGRSGLGRGCSALRAGQIRGLGRVWVSRLDAPLRAGIYQGLLATVEPTHHIRGSAVIVAERNDDPSPPAVTDVGPFEHETITELCLHGFIFP